MKKFVWDTVCDTERYFTKNFLVFATVLGDTLPQWSVCVRHA